MKDAANQRQTLATNYIITIIIIIIIIVVVIVNIHAPNSDTQFNTVLFTMFHVSLTYSFIKDEINETGCKQKGLLKLFHSVSGIKRVTGKID